AEDPDVGGVAGVAGAVAEPDGCAAPAQGVVGGQADRAGAEDDVPCGRHAVTSIGGPAGRGAAAVRYGRSSCSRSPDSADTVRAPLRPTTVNCSSTLTPMRVVAAQPRAHTTGMAAAQTHRDRVRRGSAAVCAAPTSRPVIAP